MIMARLADYTLLMLFLQTFLGIMATQGEKKVNEAEQKLMEKLFPKTEIPMKDVLPVTSDSVPVNLSMQIALRQIMDVVEKDQIISLSVWIRQYWNNPLLTWETADYNNISSINVEKNLVWVPDLCLYNTADDSGSVYQQLDTKLIINNHGDCTWLAPLILRAECKMNVRYFPFDEQSCVITFGSWTYNGKRINLTNRYPYADTSIYIQNGEWQLIEVPAQRHVDYFPCCPEPYPTLAYTVRIRRRILYYVSNLIIPCGVIAALAFLSFYLPADSGERVGLVITVLLAMTVYMLMVSNAMPPTSEVIPLIGKFYLAVMIEIALCLVATCVTIKWYHTQQPMTPAIKNVVRVFHRILCGKRRTITKNPDQVVTADATYYHVNNHEPAAAAAAGGNQQKEVTNAEANINQVQLREIIRNPISEIEAINKDVTVLSQKIQEEVEEEKIRGEWKEGVEVLDRLFFILFTATFIIFSIVLFSAVPSYKD